MIQGRYLCGKDPFLRYILRYRGDCVDFKTYVQTVVAAYVEKKDNNVIFIKHYMLMTLISDMVMVITGLSLMVVLYLLEKNIGLNGYYMLTK